jgi:AbrB family looped-hinge helix DNA binding protein
MYHLKVTSRGRITIPPHVWRHLGVRPGEEIELELLPRGKVLLRAAPPTGSIEKFIGFLAGRTKKIATIEEMNEAAAKDRAGQVK